MNVFQLNGRSIHIVNSAKPNFDKFSLLDSAKLQNQVASITAGSPRSMAYRDAYALVFYLSRNAPVPAIGDLRVTRTFIELGILHYDRENHTLSPGEGLPNLINSGEIRMQNGTRYQAVLN